ncbi:SDR family oxidoreductase [Trinickia caryophylli]|uniref:NAD(P)-dependent dehydrogenase, short-chain alcohol dehydrogenase family n=1 Tax=Trinickia caryophylli TaxID=28094 RepID=A0A1X7E939_TRICW|nr:SDR family oxidoreductase [Trinickia caryophylli]PMS13010.1 short-chain dehydrogenase [Trinickia caryophylli]TRX14771.1 SDR family oxidoreductase [Trinickia caryophylli]WQE14617.1 SDR family oxidoreductase [Trinickia caryophylli]SMF29776.1 NAD(P)-dependent dehydrogenase, short-chain alcohol dehydrogenase family [Trinickia caryophylli]GLU31966.1 short-chain dehydrogenase/reductase [Trinickia caryophylli]
MTPPTPSAPKAIVTGHTRGLGAALSEALLARGFVVLGVSRTRQATLDSRYADAVEQAEVDLADTRAIEQWLAQGQLRRFVSHAAHAVLINNAGTVAPIGPCGEQPPLEVARAVVLNVAAPLMLASAFSEATCEAADRRIAHVSSGAARNPYAGWSIYCATKAALDHHARAAALDGERGMRIATIAPGVVDTDMQAALRATDEARFPSRGKFVDLKATGKLTSPDEAAHKFVDYLLSDAFGTEPAVDLRSLPAG